MNRFIFLTMVLRADGTVTTNSGMQCIHKSYIVYLEIYVVPMDFYFLVMEKSWKINVEKEVAPCFVQSIQSLGYSSVFERWSPKKGIQ